jgi:hypothetical protein
LLTRVDADVFLIAQDQEGGKSTAKLDSAGRDVLGDVEDANGREIRFGGVYRVNVC